MSQDDDSIIVGDRVVAIRNGINYRPGRPRRAEDGLFNYAIGERGVVTSITDVGCYNILFEDDVEICGCAHYNFKRDTQNYGQLGICTSCNSDTKAWAVRRVVNVG